MIAMEFISSSTRAISCSSVNLSIAPSVFLVEAKQGDGVFEIRSGELVRHIQTLNCGSISSISGDEAMVSLPCDYRHQFAEHVTGHPCFRAPAVCEANAVSARLLTLPQRK